MFTRIIKEGATVPLFIGQTLVNALRDLGYNDTTSAVCEFVDNSVQWGAEEVRVYFRESGKKGQKRIDVPFLIGTPVNKYDFGYLRDCEKPMLFLHGTQDEYGDAAKLEKVVEHVRNAESVIVTGADHFFTKQLEAVEETMRGWAEELLES